MPAKISSAAPPANTGAMNNAPPITVAAGSGGDHSAGYAGRLIKGGGGGLLKSARRRVFYFTIFVDGEKVGTTEWSTYRELRKRMNVFLPCWRAQDQQPKRSGGQEETSGG